MTVDDAKEIALKHLHEQSRGAFTPKIIEKDTINADRGWIFFYDSQEFLETGDFSGAIAGNGAVAVSKRDGTVYSLRPSIVTEDIVADFASRVAS